MTITFRLTSEDLYSEGQAYLRRMRAIKALDSAPFLATNQATKWGTDHSQINRRSIARSIAPKPSDPGETDTNYMKLFIQNSELSKVILPVIANRRQILPDGLPIIDVLRVHLDKRDAWKYPSSTTMASWVTHRGYNDQLLDTVERDEIIIGQTTESQTVDIANWAIEHYQSSEDANPIGALPFSVEYVAITSHDVIRLGRPELAGKSFRLQSNTNPPKAEEEDWFQTSDGKSINNEWTRLPAKICLGNGLTWLLTISFPIIQKEQRFIATPGPLQAGLVQFLHHLPPLVGYNIKTDVVSVESTLSTMYNFRLSLPHFIYLPSLAVLAGWKMTTISSEALSMVCLGTPVNHLISYGDGLWAIPFDSLPSPLTIYIIGEIKNIFLVYNVLATCLREEILSDPDVWCFITKKLQRYTLAWWAEWLTHVLKGVYVDKKALQAANTRQEAVEAIRALDPEGELHDHPPYRIKVAALMLTNTITVMRGGPRFLHIEREKALHKLRLFDHLNVSSFENIIKSS